MHVLLIWPRNLSTALNDDMSCCEPLPLEYLAGAIKGHHSVEIFDERLDEPLDEWARSHPTPDVVGVAIPYTISVPSSRRVTAWARSLWAEAVIVLGGHHPTVTDRWMDGFSADWVIKGEGGALFCHLLDAIERREEPLPLPGLSQYGSVGLPLAAKSPLGQLQSTALPDRDILARHRPRYFHSTYHPVSTIRFSAGCPHTCNFCSLWRLTGQRYLTKDTERILEELAQIESPNVYVVDDEAFIQPGRMRELAEAIDDAKLNKRFHMYLRTDTALRNPDVIERWAEIGLDSVLVGAESMSETELDSYRKRTRPNQTRQAMELFHANAVKVRANFLVDPSWHDADFDQLERTVVDLNVDTPSFSVLTPLPGTDMFDQIQQDILTDDPEMFDLYHSVLATRLPPARFHERMARLLAVAAGRSDDGSEAIFYFGDNQAFSRMLDNIRNRWDPKLAGVA